jgi:hypothetical protein
MAIRNIHGVPKAAWKKWSEDGRRTFNDMYGLFKDQDMVCHPKADKVPQAHWKTIRWNAAWAAASYASESWP